MRKLIDESKYNASNIIFGMTRKYNGNTYASYVRVSNNGLITLNSNVERSNVKPVKLLTNACDTIKNVFGELTDEQLYEYCDFGIIK
ncbi:hypothetical protein [Photobacterium nomapromontoriensis]|uniref:hypothetical protein n=1 Tax=Photobacterium nomapromontoriensis TaxID=2910237 RepID=UPI003D0F96CD